MKYRVIDFYFWPGKENQLTKTMTKTKTIEGYRLMVTGLLTEKPSNENENRDRDFNSQFSKFVPASTM